MCVIMLCQKTRPTEEMIDKGWAQNDDGAGIAWRENGEVHFEKGVMELAEIKDLIAKVPLPFVVHFRVASVGGVKQTLTHPFPIGKEASLLLRGKTKGAVLFHNGHWGDWNAKAMEAAIHSNTGVPVGDWSDTRAIAWMMAIYGPGFMEFLPSQRGIYFTPKTINVFTGPGWTQINNVWCSNDIFWTKNKSHNSNYGVYGRVCHVGRCTNKAAAGKTICEDCEKKNVAPGTSGTNAVAALPAQGQTTGATGTTGSTTAPFAPAGTFLTMKQAEVMFRAGDMSKAMLKRFRRHHDQLASKSLKSVTKATKALNELTLTANQRLLRNGSRG